MQGWETFIPTEMKVEYINQLLKVGFDTIDFGSFVSPRAVPQMSDTAEVLSKLDLSASGSKLLAIVANLRGAEAACQYQEITFLGFPLSLSETFQQKNTNRSIEDALAMLQEIQNLCVRQNKTLVTYLSMGFGNPYGDPYEPELVAGFTEKLSQMGVRIVSLADTSGVATPATISSLFNTIIPAFPAIEFGAHLHSTRETVAEKIEAVYEAGCRRIDGAINGFGGCPMAGNALVGNVATEAIVSFARKEQLVIGLDQAEFEKALLLAGRVFV